MLDSRPGRLRERHLQPNHQTTMKMSANTMSLPAGVRHSQAAVPSPGRTANGRKPVWRSAKARLTRTERASTSLTAGRVPAAVRFGPYSRTGTRLPESSTGRLPFWLNPSEENRAFPRKGLESPFDVERDQRHGANQEGENRDGRVPRSAAGAMRVEHHQSARRQPGQRHVNRALSHTPVRR